MSPVERVGILETAIRKHRDQRGDDRCWLDDLELYAVLGDEQPDLTLPLREEFLSNCSRFWECRQRHTDPEAAIEEYKGQPAADLRVLNSLCSYPAWTEGKE